jgi:hypothetical protein
LLPLIDNIKTNKQITMSSFLRRLSASRKKEDKKEEPPPATTTTTSKTTTTTTNTPPLPPSSKRGSNTATTTSNHNNTNDGGGGGSGNHLLDNDNIPQRTSRSKSVTFKPPPTVDDSDVNQVLRARSKSFRSKEGRKSVTWAEKPNIGS